MINSINTNIPAAMRPEPKLTSEQSETVLSVLEQYDAETLTESDAKTIVQTFKEAGIRPSGELKSLMAEAGFDAREVADLSGITGADSGVKPPQPPVQSRVNNEALQQLQDILNNYQDLNQLSEQEQQQLNQSLFDAGLLAPGALITLQL